MESAPVPGVAAPQVQIAANAIQILMQVTVDGLMTMSGPQRLLLKSQDGKLEIKVPPEAFNFLVPGAVVPVTLSIVQVLVNDTGPSAVQEEGGLILPPGTAKPEGEPN